MTEFLFDTRAGLMLFGVIVLVVLVLISYYISLPFDRWWVGRQLAKTTSEAYRSEKIPLPPELEPGRNAFMELGFEPVDTIRHQEGSIFTFLLGSGGRTVAEVASLKRRMNRRKGPTEVVLELTSSLTGRRGVMVTSTSGLGLHLWSAELRQVFPGASAQHLVRYHDDALRWLVEQGIEADPQTAEEVMTLRADALRRANGSAAKASAKTIRTELLRSAQGRHKHVGVLTEQADIDARLETLWHAVQER